MKKKKVLFLIHTLQVGGAEKVLVNLVNKLDKNKFDITVMTVVNTGAFRYELNKDIKYKTIINLDLFRKKNNNEKKESGNLFSKTSKLKKYLAKGYQFMWRHINCKKIYEKFITEKYDIEVAFLEGISAKIISQSSNKNSKKIAWIHVDLINERKTEKFFKNLEEEKKVYDKFDKIVSVSKNVKEQFYTKFKINENKLLVKYNPIDEKIINNLSEEKITDITKNKFTLCTVGRLSIQKGYDRLLKVVERLNQDNLNFDLWIIGVGSEEKKLKDYINEHNLDNVFLLGYKKNPYKYIKNSDLFVCSSRAEGFSTVVSESIILEKPIVTTDCSGMHELLGENNEYGIVCENNEECLYESLYKILSDSKVYNKYAKKVKERKNIFNIDISIKDIEELLLK